MSTPVYLVVDSSNGFGTAKDYEEDGGSFSIEENQQESQQEASSFCSTKRDDGKANQEGSNSCIIEAHLVFCSTEEGYEEAEFSQHVPCR